MTTSDWLSALAEAGPPEKAHRLPDGDGWYTLADIMKKTGWKEFTIRRYLRGQIKAEKMELFRGTKTSMNGRVSPQIWYRAKP